MPSKAPYIFLALLVIVLYEVYSIVYYRWQDYQIDTYIRTVQSDTNRLKNSLEEKRAHLAMVQTNAWIDKTIKKTQNRKNP
jgi:predicted ATP-grasp superfamily ATP-dependent carboligase